MNLTSFRLLICLYILIASFSLVYTQTPEKVNQAYLDKVQRVFDYKQDFLQVHPFVQHLYPIAIAHDGYFYVFDLVDGGEAYALKTWEKTGMHIPEGVRAAFPLEFYDTKCACIVSGDVFDSPEGYVTIFHEFVHCHQWHTVEPGLRAELPLAVRMAEEKNYMWEMDHPFPYHNEWFVNTYSAFIDALDQGDTQKAMQLRHLLQTNLTDEDYQYMVWQEWKEGFALYIENMLKNKNEIQRNMVGRSIPYSRTVFYAGGEAFIRYLITENPELNEDIRTLFKRMLQSAN
jgi:hypothetical protein